MHREFRGQHKVHTTHIFWRLWAHPQPSVPVDAQQKVEFKGLCFQPSFYIQKGRMNWEKAFFLLAGGSEKKSFWRQLKTTHTSSWTLPSPTWTLQISEDIAGGEAVEPGQNPDIEASTRWKFNPDTSSPRSSFTLQSTKSTHLDILDGSLKKILEILDLLPNKRDHRPWDIPRCTWRAMWKYSSIYNSPRIFWVNFFFLVPKFVSGHI